MDISDNRERHDSQSIKHRLTEIICELLRVETKHITAEANLMDYGGNSLTVILLLQKINEDFGLELELDHIIDHYTVAGLAQLIMAQLSVEEIKNACNND